MVDTYEMDYTLHCLCSTCAGHGDDCPVECLRQGVEHGVGLILLQGVTQAGEYQHSHRDCHGQ